MKILKLKAKKNNKYELIFDNKESITLYEDVILDNGLLYKKEIDESLYNKIIKQNDYYKNYNDVIKYATRKLRSEYEIDKYLMTLDINKKEVKEKLRKLNLLNDKAYAEAYIYDKLNLTNDGPYKIKKDLKDKKIDDNIIDNALSEYDNSIFDEKLTKLISKKKNTKYSNYVFKNKMLNYFINLGYDREMIISKLNDTDTKDIIKKDYDVLYNKLSKKYTSDKLEYEINKKLYQKGYSYDEINTIKKG